MHNRKLPTIAATLALLAVMVGLFAPAIFQGKILAPLDITATLLPPWGDPKGPTKPHNHNPTDAVTQYLPYRLFAEESLRNDGYIGWNPYEMGGYSLAGNTMALPGSWPMQLHRWLPFKDAWNLGIFCEFLIAGIGMLVFLRGRKLSWLPCLVGSAVFMLNSQFIIWIYHRWALGSFCWMPWVLWAGVGWQKSPVLTPRRCLLPVFLALAFLGGTLQHMAFVVIACGCIWAGGFIDFRDVIRSWRSSAAWMTAGMIALAISAFSIVPQVQGYFANVSIGHVRGGLGYESGPLQPLTSLLFIPLQVWPLIIGTPQTLDGFKILGRDFMNVAYMGTIPMVLAAAGIFAKGMPREAKWLVVAGILLPLTPLVGPLYHRVQLLALLGGAWMVAEMMTNLHLHVSPRQMRCLLTSALCIGLGLTACTLARPVLTEQFGARVVEKSLAAADGTNFGSDKAWIERRAREWIDRLSLTHPQSAWLFLLLVLGAGGVALARTRHPARQLGGQSLILGVAILELGTFFSIWTTFSDPGMLQSEPEEITKIRELAGLNRVTVDLGPTPLGQSFAAPNLLASRGIRSLDAYESIQYQNISRACREFPVEKRLSLAGVALHSVAPANIHAGIPATWPVVLESHGYTFRLNPAPIAELLAGTGAPPSSQEDLLPTVANAKTIVPLTRTMNHLRFAVPDTTRWVRFSANWHPGWKWREDAGPWQSCNEGPDSAVWLERSASRSGTIEFRFRPVESWLRVVSVAGLFCAGFLFVASAARIHPIKFFGTG